MRITELGRSAGRLSPLALALLVVALLFGAAGGAVAGIVVTGSNIKDGTVTSADIKNDSLTRADVVDEPRAWGASVTQVDNFTSTNFSPIVSRGLTTTAAGFLTITATIYGEDDFGIDGIGDLEYALRIDGKTIDAYRALDFQGEEGLGGSVTVVVPAKKGAHMVRLVGREDGSGSYIQAADLSVVYTPAGVPTTVDFLTRPVPKRSANR